MVINLYGYEVLIDEEDVERVLSKKWKLKKSDLQRFGKIYFSCFDPGTRDQKITLHRFVMGSTHCDGIFIDHINGNTLDNRKLNLRPCNNQENQWNRKINKNNKSGFKGVYQDKKSGRWRAVISINKKRTHLGSFADPKTAHAVYVESAKKYYGEFARAK